MSMKKHKIFTDNNEIDLAAFITLLWMKRGFIIKSTIIAMVIGLVIALFSMKEFQTSVTLLPESSSTMDFGNIGSLASSFGIGGFNKMDGEAVDPVVYPEIVSSVSFMKKILESDIYVEKLDSTMSLFTYINANQPFSFKNTIKKLTVRLPYTVIGLFKSKKELPEGDGSDSDILYMSYEKWLAYENISSRISLNINDKLGLVTISVKMPEPTMATQVAKMTQDYLVEFLTEYKIEKTQNTLSFVENQLEEATERFERTQMNLAEIADQNHGDLTNKAKIKLQNAENEYDLAFKIYSAMLQKRDELRLSLQEDAPLVKIVEPVYYPKEKSSPRRGFIMIVSVFLGVFLSIIYLFLKESTIYVAEKNNIEFSLKEFLSFNKNDD